jgi:hypothetical protein
LGIRKSLLFLPTRSDQYKADPDELHFITIKINAIGSKKNNNRNEANIKSKDLFIFKFFIWHQEINFYSVFAQVPKKYLNAIFAIKGKKITASQVI